MIAPRVSKGFSFVCVSSAARVVGAAETGEIGTSKVGSFFFGGGRLALSGRDGATRVVSFFGSAGVDDTVDAALARVSSVPPANGSNDVEGAEGGGATFIASREATSLTLAAAFVSFVSPFRARRAADSPSPRLAHRASACRNAFVRSGSRPATILSGLASTSGEDPYFRVDRDARDDLRQVPHFRGFVFDVGARLFLFVEKMERVPRVALHFGHDVVQEPEGGLLQQRLRELRREGREGGKRRTRMGRRSERRRPTGA
jgi:hypothetical protein